MLSELDDQKRNRLRVEFGRLGAHYYIAGRFAFFSAFIPVAGNLLHHAVEMFLKGALIRTLALEKLQSIGHDLPVLWKEFNVSVAKSDLSQFDQVIVELQRFERIRYPDKIVSEGMEASFSPVRGIRTEADDGTIPHSPEYSLILEDIDHLLKVVLFESSVNPDFYFGALREYPQQFFGLLNKHFTDR